ncbi:MAG: endonuclease/exonuclease/phosphatase family protein [Rothia sp. (in: high G+C Gram-positive bacteria)]|uniref:endonuclease/exonuclease/phosphatase family protein n=1 Tax=Rothia sp. (in: high G+C Gram-positive bacteria) TaxID=1885016 RepID=UPI0026DFA340|nr:endonuclease/exonuclease/phosphatase family protein [Rothia sp. (in: high G+C Gram-positive bacteria)]MDO5750014.1 endonuclease/exonuclease/phosphatase family protein [Rothia sp. (in: high G+C Gram-positive bacteria)]
MKFLSLNTHSWMEESQREKISALARFIHEHDVDIIALQEVSQDRSAAVISSPLNFDSRSTSLPVRADNYALLLIENLQALGAHYSWVFAEAHIGWDRYDEGVAILTKHPVEQVQALELSPEYSYEQVQRRRAIAALVDSPEGPVWIASTHMSWWNRDNLPLFAEEYTNLHRALTECAASAPAPVLLAGDFNSPAHIRSEGYDMVLSSGMYDTRELALAAAESNPQVVIEGEHTVHHEIAGWEGHSGGHRIDFIFASQALEMLSHRVVLGDNTPQALSDHSALLIACQLPRV